MLYRVVMLGCLGLGMTAAARAEQIGSGAPLPMSLMNHSEFAILQRNESRDLHHGAFAMSDAEANLYDFGRCVVRRDAAGGLAFARAEPASAAGQAIRMRLQPVLSACRNRTAAPTHGRYSDEFSRRAAVAEALREKFGARRS